MELQAVQGQDMSITQVQLCLNYLFIFYRCYFRVSIYVNTRLSFPPLHYWLQNCRLTSLLGRGEGELSKQYN